MGEVGRWLLLLSQEKEAAVSVEDWDWARQWKWTLHSKGYAYRSISHTKHIFLHQVIAERKLGRVLVEGEEVHHDNRNKLDCRRDNLIVKESVAHHRLVHRKTEHGLRLPDEGNPVLTCLCGCGEIFLKFDEQGRPRIFISGHNSPVASPTQDAILHCLRDGPKSRKQIIVAIKTTKAATATCLYKMKQAGKVKPLGAGVWALS